MSTNTRQSTESQPTDTRPAPTDARSVDPASTEATLPTEATSDPDDAESWVRRCQRQFDPDRTDRLRNLADEANEAMLE